MCCLILKLQDPKLEKCRLNRTKRYINYNDALRPNILVVWGALCGYPVLSHQLLNLVLVKPVILRMACRCYKAGVKKGR